MLKFYTKSVLSLFLVFNLLVAVACAGGGPLSKLDSTLDFAPLFFQGLVISGAISQTQADKYKTGVTRFESIADNTKQCLATAITTVQKAGCYTKLGDDSRAAIAEFYPAVNNQKVSEFASLLNDVVNLIVKKNTPSVGVGAPATEVTDKQISDKIDELNRLLKSEGR